MESYRIEWRKSTKKDLRKISLHQVSKIILAVEKLANNPYPNGSIKLTGSEDTYRIRIGNYRVIYRVFITRIILKLIELGIVRMHIVNRKLRKPNQSLHLTGNFASQNPAGEL